MKKQFNPFITAIESKSEETYSSYICKKKTAGPYYVDCEYYIKPGPWGLRDCADKPFHPPPKCKMSND